MRDAFCRAMVELGKRSGYVFMTGDLGYLALEPLREALGPRFINAGLAEQNMIGTAAGLADDGVQAWAYSIAPFIYARPYEQIRNDVCLHGLDVKLVGNGGGYGYGPMGATHHAIEDYGALLALRGMRACVPAFDEDIAACVDALAAVPGPAYLRLGRGEKPAGWDVPAYGAWRLLLDGGGPLLVAVGPLAGPMVAACLALPQASRPQIWCLAELPAPGFPPAFLDALKQRGHLAVLEEHVAQGSAGAALGLALLQRGLAPAKFQHFCAQGYPSRTYGSQAFHRRECGLDAPSVLAALGAA